MKLILILICIKYAYFDSSFFKADFDRMVLYVGKKEIPMERLYAPSVYINYFSALYQTTLYLVVHKLQIDNQLYKTMFPVLFSKVLPPKSVASSNMSKPIVEMSMIQTHCQRTKTSQMKYFKVLIQEFFIKLDIDFLNCISRFLTVENVNFENCAYY